MSTTISKIEKTQKGSEPKVESEKVSRFLKVRFKVRRQKSELAGTLDALATKVDPRKSQEDYLRTEQRLQELVNATREDPMLKGDTAVVASLAAADTAIGAAAGPVEAAQAKGQRPDYAQARKPLQTASDKLNAAINAAAKRCDKHADDNPALVQKLDLLLDTIDDPAIRATAEQVATWRTAHGKIEEAFYKPGADLKKVDTLVGALSQKVGEVVVANGAQAKAVKELSDGITMAMARSTDPVGTLAPVNALVQRAAQEAGGLDYKAALATLAEARRALPKATAGDVPSMAEIEKRRTDLFGEGVSTLKGGVTSDPAKARVIALMGQLEALRPLCQQAGGVEVEAVRRVEACEKEFAAIKNADKDAAAFAKEKRDTWQPFIADKVETLTKALAAAPQDGAVIALALRVDALAKSFKAEWPKLMTMKDIDASGLLREATALDEAYDDLKAQQRSGSGGARTWEQAFHDASGALAQVTERAKQSDVGLLKTLGLASKMPALVAKGGALLVADDKAAAEKEVRAITQTLLDTVNVARTRLDSAVPPDQAAKEGKVLLDAFLARIDVQIEALEALQPGKKMAKAKNVARFFKESAFSDDGEREARLQYGLTLRASLEAVGNLLACKDATAAQGALAELRGSETLVRDFESMGRSAASPNTKQGDAPPTFHELGKRIKEIQKKLAENAKNDDLGTRVDTLKDWNLRATALSDGIGEGNPRDLEREVGRLEREILEVTAADKLEIGRANEQINQVTALLLKLMDARKKGSPLAAEFGLLLAALQRQGEAMRKGLLHTKVTDASFEAWKKDVDSLLDTRRSDAASAGLRKSSDKAAADDKAVEEARKALLKMRDVDLKLWRENAKALTKAKKATMLALLDDLDKEVGRGLDSLDENRDADTAKLLARSMLRELQEASMGAGDEVTERGELDQLDAKWQAAVDGLKASLDRLVVAVKAAAQGQAADIQAAAEALEPGAVAPVMAMFGKMMFTRGIKAMASPDAKVRANNREAVLADVRRVRRAMEADTRVRLLLDNEFGVVVPLPEIGNRLLDIEVNVTRARGG